MAEKSSLAPIPDISTRLSCTGRVSKTLEDRMVEEGEGSTIKLQFRRAYKNLRCLVRDLLSRERHGMLGRRKSGEASRSSLSDKGMKANPSKSAEHLPDTPKKCDEKGSAMTALELNKTVLDTLSTILSSCPLEEDWDPLVNTTTTPLDDTAAEVRPGLYISGFLAEQNREDLQSKRITHILQVGENLTRSFDGEFEYKTLRLMDTCSTSILPVLKECLEFLDQCISNGGAALVHCYAGISRSATICIAYLMWRENLTLGPAFSVVEKARNVIQPNEGFKHQLQIFESLGANFGNLDHYLSRQAAVRRPYRELSSDDWDPIL